MSRDLLEKVVEKTGVTKSVAIDVLNTITQSIVNSVKEGNRVLLSGLGSFSQQTRAAKKGRNPKTGEPIDIPEKIVPKFKPSKVFKEALQS